MLFSNCRTDESKMTSSIVLNKPTHLVRSQANQRCVENFLLIWFDPNLNSDDAEKQARKILHDLQHIIN